MTGRAGGEHRIPTRQATTSTGAGAKPSLARQLSELARELETAGEVDEVMQRVVDAAEREIDGAIGAAITLLTDGVVTSPTHSSELMAEVEAVEDETGQGPCVDSARDSVTLRSDDLSTEVRWPLFATRVAALGVLSVLSFQLFVERDSMGALNVYGGEAHCFDEEAESSGLLLASHAAIAIAGTRKVANLRIGMDSRDVIGQAKGILMERFKINSLNAFDLLVVASQSSHRRVRDIAEELATTGEFAQHRNAGPH